jgi:hypothetical protein
VKFGLKTITGIFYNGPYVWDLVSPRADPASKIEELHEGGLLDNIFHPGISVSVSGNKFKLTRWGIGRLPMSGNSFVHVFAAKICRAGSQTIVRGNFRLNVFVFGFALFWLTMAYLLGGVLAVGSAAAYLRDGAREARYHGRRGRQSHGRGLGGVSTLGCPAKRRARNRAAFVCC